MNKETFPRRMREVAIATLATVSLAGCDIGAPVDAVYDKGLEPALENVPVPTPDPK